MEGVMKHNLRNLFGLFIMIVLVFSLIPINRFAQAKQGAQQEIPNSVNEIFLPLITNNFVPITPSEMVFIPAGNFQMGCDPNHNGGFN